MNAPQLKNSILQYAMQGKLVPQDLNDEPATALLEKVCIKKEQLIQEKIFKKEKKLSPLSSEEIPFDIPENWKWIKLEDIAFITGGYAFKSSDYIQDGVRVIRISDFNEKGFVNNKIVRHVYSESYKNFLIEENNILLCMTGGTVGKSLFVRNISEPMMTNQRVATIKVNPAIAPDFVNFAILSPAVQEIITNCKNSTNDNISMSTIKRFPIPLPPIQEQKRIVNKVKELFNKTDRFNSNKKNIDKMQLEFSKKLENSILHYAIQGKLVEQDSNDEPAAELIKRIREEKARLIKEKIIKKEKPLPPITEEEIPFDIPENWEWVRIGEIFKLQAGKNITSSQISENPTEEYRYPCYGGNGKRGYVKMFNKQGKYALIGRQGALCGNINFAEGQFYASEHAVVVDHFNLLDVQWSGYFLEALKLNQYATATAQPGLAVSNIVNKLIPLPPFEEQKRIVEKIEESSTLIKNLKSKVE